MIKKKVKKSKKLTGFIYTVTTVRGKKNNYDPRTVAWYPELEMAIRVVEENMGDIWELGYYPWAVVECVPPGLYPLNSDFAEKDRSKSKEILWYHWDEKLEKYVRSNPPKEFGGGTVGFMSIG